MTKEEILDFIDFNKKTENEEIFSIIKDCYVLVAKLILQFGFKDSLYKEPLLLMKEYIKLMKVETNIYDYILTYLDYLDFNDTYFLLEKVDELHEKAYNRLDKDLADMEVGLEINDTNRLRRSRNTDILINYNDYYDDAHRLRKID